MAINISGVDDVRDHIRNIFESLRRRLSPAPAPQRAAALRPTPAGSAVRLRPISPMAAEPYFLRGEDTALVRPYLVAHERREEQLRRQRRRNLWLAVHGIDAGPRWIHGVEVPTR